MNGNFAKMMSGAVLLTMLVGCGQGWIGGTDSFVDDELQATLEAKPVALLWAESYKSGHYGIPALERTFRIVVQNLAYNKKVSVHHERIGQGWEDLAASYVGPAGNGNEIWEAKIMWNAMTGPSTCPYGTHFVLKYEVNGKTYWDNNGAQNYDLAEHSGPMFGAGLNVIVRSATRYERTYGNPGTTLYGTLNVRNLAYHKALNVIYTTDSWKSAQVVPASFVSFYGPAYATPIMAPNAYGIEPWSWSVDLPFSVSVLEFVIAYDVNGTTYWDNNFGQNYRLTK
jgi:hypothetical protein